MRPIRRYFAVLSLMGLCTSAQAAVSLGIDAWGWHASGSVQNQGDRLDFDDDLRIDARGSSILHLGWQPEIGSWWPALGLQTVDLQARGENEVPAGTQFGPITFTPSGPITGGPDTVTLFSRADLTDRDALAHWRFDWRGLRWQPGLRLRQLEGEIIVRDNDGNSDVQSFDETFPQLHLGLEAGADQALTLQLQADWISDGDNRAYEWLAALRWNGFGPMSLRLGWRVKRYEILDPDNDYRLNALLAGPQLGLVISLP